MPLGRLLGRRREKRLRELCEKLRSSTAEEQRQLLKKIFKSSLIHRLIDMQWPYETEEYRHCAEEARREGIPEALCIFAVFKNPEHQERLKAVMKPIMDNMGKTKVLTGMLALPGDYKTLEKLLEVCRRA